MKKLDIVISKWESDVVEQEIELIERGVTPYNAHEIAVSMVSKRRRDKKFSEEAQK